MGRFVLILAVIAIAVFACWKFIPIDTPFYREISDNKGRSSDVEVIGKSKSGITVVYENTAERTDIAFSKLSLADRIYFYRVRKKDPPRLEVPFKRELTDANGRKITAQIVGKSSSGVTVVVEGTKHRSDIPFSNLSPEDIQFLSKIRTRTPPEVAEQLVKDVPYVERRKAEIEELKKKAAILQLQISSGTLNDILVKNRTIQYQTVTKEIRVLETAIETYKWRNKIQ